MIWNNLGKYYGFKSPFNFKIAIPFLLNALGLILVIAACAVLFTNAGLRLGTERFYFLSYIAILLFVGAVISRIPSISYVMFCWCAFELGLAVSSAALSSGSYAFGSSPLFPRDRFTQPPSNRLGDGFTYHPLLQRVPKQNWRGKWHFDMRNKADFINFPINWTEVEGREFTASHNSHGLRGAELAEDDLKKDMIFVYGGSTTYDATVTQGETWVERLQSGLNGEYTVVNFGVLAHSTTEHLIQTAFYQSIGGKKPICAIYYVGWNDLRSAHIENLDGAYADYHLPLVAARKREIYFAKYSPLVRLLNQAVTNRFDTLQAPPKFPVAGSNKRLEEIFVEHISTITSINDSRGIVTVFIGQILNRELFKFEPKGPNFHTPLLRNEEVWPLQERFNLLLKATSISNGAKYIDAGIENFKDSDFVDQGHFSGAGSKRFATLIAREVESYCRKFPRQADNL